MVGYKDTSKVAKKAAEVTQKKSNNRPMMREQLRWGIASKPKAQNPQ